MASGILVLFLGALQASLSVLLTIFTGVITAQYNLLSQESSKEISKTCVHIFLPALLIYNVGSQVTLDTLPRYYPIIIWAILYNVLSIAIGYAAARFFKMPPWVTPAIAFNNTTSLPLILIASLESTGILSSILMSSGDTQSAAVERAKSYFLVNSVIGNCITFAVGGELLNAHEEDAPNQSPEKKNDDNDNKAAGHRRHTDDQGIQGPERAGDVETGPVYTSTHYVPNAGHQAEQHSDAATEETSLLPNHVTRESRKAGRATYADLMKIWVRLPAWSQKMLLFLYQFINAPVIGAAIGLLIGLVPALHQACFGEPTEGGFLEAWLIDAIKNIGNIFAVLQVVVVGVKLSKALLAMKAGESEEEAGSIPWVPALFVELMRFVVWPLISIPVIWAIATKTSWLRDDPVLWFAMMLMPTGPPAMKLTALADCTGADEKQKMTIAKFLTLSYVISPIIAFAVVGSLKATEAAMGDAF